MSEKESNNTFRFSLCQGQVLLCEKAFDADQFNPFTRYSIDIRELLPKAITKLQKVLSKKKYDIVLDGGRLDSSDEYSERLEYDLYHYAQAIMRAYGVNYNPQTIIQQIEEKTIRGVECKIGFYINENPIVERLFYVDGFNPVARWSVDVLDAVTEIADKIFGHIKSNDVKNMWDDYDLINVRGLSINQIRELSSLKREELLRRIHRN